MNFTLFLLKGNVKKLINSANHIGFSNVVSGFLHCRVPAGIWFGFRVGSGFTRHLKIEVGSGRVIDFRVGFSGFGFSAQPLINSQVKKASEKQKMFYFHCQFKHNVVNRGQIKGKKGKLPGIWQTKAALSGPLQYRVFHLYPLCGSTETHIPISWSSVNSPQRLLGVLPMASNDRGGGNTSSL